MDLKKNPTFNDVTDDSVESSSFGEAAEQQFVVEGIVMESYKTIIKWNPFSSTGKIVIAEVQGKITEIDELKNLITKNELDETQIPKEKIAKILVVLTNQKIIFEKIVAGDKAGNYKMPQSIKLTAKTVSPEEISHQTDSIIKNIEQALQTLPNDGGVITHLKKLSEFITTQTDSLKICQQNIKKIVKSDEHACQEKIKAALKEFDTLSQRIRTLTVAFSPCHELYPDKPTNFNKNIWEQLPAIISSIKTNLKTNNRREAEKIIETGSNIILKRKLPPQHQYILIKQLESLLAEPKKPTLTAKPKAPEKKLIKEIEVKEKRDFISPVIDKTRKHAKKIAWGVLGLGGIGLVSMAGNMAANAIIKKITEHKEKKPLQTVAEKKVEEPTIYSEIAKSLPDSPMTHPGIQAGPILPGTTSPETTATSFQTTDNLPKPEAKASSKNEELSAVQEKQVFPKQENQVNSPENQANPQVLDLTAGNEITGSAIGYEVVIGPNQSGKKALLNNALQEIGKWEKEGKITPEAAKDLTKRAKYLAGKSVIKEDINKRVGTYKKANNLKRIPDNSAVTGLEQSILARHLDSLLQATQADRQEVTAVGVSGKGIFATAKEVLSFHGYSKDLMNHLNTEDGEKVLKRIIEESNPGFKVSNNFAAGQEFKINLSEVDKLQNTITLLQEMKASHELQKQKKEKTLPPPDNNKKAPKAHKADQTKPYLDNPTSPQPEKAGWLNNLKNRFFSKAPGASSQNQKMADLRQAKDNKEPVYTQTKAPEIPKSPSARRFRIPEGSSAWDFVRINLPAEAFDPVALAKLKGRDPKTYNELMQARVWANSLNKTKDGDVVEIISNKFVRFVI